MCGEFFLTAIYQCLLKLKWWNFCQHQCVDEQYTNINHYTPERNFQCILQVTLESYQMEVHWSIVFRVHVTTGLHHVIRNPVFVRIVILEQRVVIVRNVWKMCKSRHVTDVRMSSMECTLCTKGAEVSVDTHIFTSQNETFSPIWSNLFIVRDKINKNWYRWSSK